MLQRSIAMAIPSRRLSRAGVVTKRNKLYDHEVLNFLARQGSSGNSAAIESPSGEGIRSWWRRDKLQTLIMSPLNNQSVLPRLSQRNVTMVATCRPKRRTETHECQGYICHVGAI